MLSGQDGIAQTVRDRTSEARHLRSKRPTSCANECTEYMYVLYTLLCLVVPALCHQTIAADRRERRANPQIVAHSLHYFYARRLIRYPLRSL